MEPLGEFRLQRGPLGGKLSEIFLAATNVFARRALDSELRREFGGRAFKGFGVARRVFERGDDERFKL